MLLQRIGLKDLMEWLRVEPVAADVAPEGISGSLLPEDVGILEDSVGVMVFSHVTRDDQFTDGAVGIWQHTQIEILELMNQLEGPLGCLMILVGELMAVEAIQCHDEHVGES